MLLNAYYSHNYASIMWGGGGGGSWSVLERSFPPDPLLDRTLVHYYNNSIALYLEILCNLPTNNFNYLIHPQFM